MHRSGTSLVASSLAAAGIAMGERLLPADERNRPGYFEDLDFLALDRRMLAAAVTPDDGGHPDWGWTEGERLDAAVFAAHRTEAQQLVAARQAAGRPWGFKDPRAALLLDFWLEVAPEARFVLPYRLPWEVAESMQRLGADVFLRRPDYGYRIWAFYNRHLVDFHRRHRERTLLFSIDAAVADPDRFAAALRETLGLEVADDLLAARFDPRLLHRLAADDPLVPLAGAAHPQCVELLAALDAEAALPASGLWHSAPPRARRQEGDPRISVVVPCHDDGEFLLEAVASVERSVEVPHELIVVDDGSRDPRTVAILDLLADAGYDVRRQPAGGLAAARNHGFSSARAPFVLPLDADNRLLPGFVETALATLDEAPRLGAAYGDRIEFGARGGRVEVGFLDAARLLAGNYIDACAVVRRQAWEECGGYDSQMPLQGWEDWDLWLALIGRGWQLGWLGLPAFEYRVRPLSMARELATSPDLPRAAAYVVGKHHDLYLRQLQAAVGALAAERERAERTQGELARASAALARSSEALEETRRALEAVEGDRRRLAAEREALDGQRRALHASLALWRQRTSEAEPARTAGPGNALVRLRSRLEGRWRGGQAHPCVIGATGGSGTRAFARLAAAGGLAIGTERNEFEDALPVERFLDRWLLPFWQGGGGRAPHPAPPGMDEDFAATLAELWPGGVGDDGRCGWKSPRSLYVLPFLAQRLPDLRFLHVVRDGRDMALSANQLQLGRYGTLLLTPEEQGWPEPERSIALWRLINTWAADVGAGLGSAYLRVRWEDLCARPVPTARRVFRFFDLPGDPRPAARLVETPASLGRGRRADPRMVARLEEIAGPVLDRFGYG